MSAVRAARIWKPFTDTDRISARRLRLWICHSGLVLSSHGPIEAETWKSLTRWERAELGRRLRRDGWTYSEIMAVLPVGKGTLAGWCKEIRPTDEQVEAIKARMPDRKGVHRDTNWKRREEIALIRVQAALEVPARLQDPFWVAGLVLYWAEGFKSQRGVGMANSDPAALRLLIRWIRTYITKDARFLFKLNLHFNNDEPGARDHWKSELNVLQAQFYRTFIKPEGTGHRKNHLPWGVCQLTMRSSGEAWHRIDSSIQELRHEWGGTPS